MQMVFGASESASCHNCKANFSPQKETAIMNQLPEENRAQRSSPTGLYLTLGITFGICLGVLVGLLTSSVGVGASMGLAAGVGIGMGLDQLHVHRNRQFEEVEQE
jgi:hypothetical protein